MIYLGTDEVKTAVSGGALSSRTKDQVSILDQHTNRRIRSKYIRNEQLILFFFHRHQSTLILIMIVIEKEKVIISIMID